MRQQAFFACWTRKEAFFKATGQRLDQFDVSLRPGDRASLVATYRDPQEVRRWRLHLRTRHTMGSLAREINPIVRGWMQYYGAFYAPRCCPSCGASTPT